jgi:hypothetical protein
MAGLTINRRRIANEERLFSTLLATRHINGKK